MGTAQSRPAPSILDGLPAQDMSELRPIPRTRVPTALMPDGRREGRQGRPLRPADASPTPSTPSIPRTNATSLQGIETVQRILFIGGSRVGKSCLINMLINPGVTKAQLSRPASIADYRMCNGTTDRVMAYNVGQHMLIDSIGLTDPRFSKAQVLDSLYQIMFNFRIGMSLIIVAIKHDIFTEEEQELAKTYEYVFGRAFYQHALLLVTHYDNPPVPAREYCALPHSPAFRTFLQKFSPDRVIVGTLQQDVDDVIDGRLEPRRAAFRNSVLHFLERHRHDDIFELRIRNIRDFLRHLWNVLSLPADQSTQQRLLSAFIETGRPNDIFFFGFQDSICLEAVETDIFVTECMHVFHFDCIRVWLQDHNTCPVCRRPIIKFLTVPQSAEPGGAARAQGAKEER